MDRFIFNFLFLVWFYIVVVSIKTSIFFIQKVLFIENNRNDQIKDNNTGKAFS